MSLSLKYTLDDLFENFEFMDNWEDKYRYLLELGEQLDAMSEDDKNEANKVEGCTSQVWLKTRTVKQNDGEIYFYFTADSDAHIVKGLIAILLITYNGKSASEIMGVDIKGIFKRLGLEENLSPTRRNGFFAIVQRIKDIAAGV